MMDLNEFWGMVSDLEMFLCPSPDCYFSTFISQSCLYGVIVASNTD